jgi:xanthine/uracil permease
VGLLTTAFLIGVAVLAPGFINRIAVFLALIFGYVISWIADQWSTVQSCTAAGKCTAVYRVDWSGVASAHWIGLPKTIVSPTFGTLSGPHLPAFSITFILLMLPSVIALLAENAGHVKAVSEMTGDDLDPYLGRAYIGDGVGIVVASFVGGSPTTTYAENIGAWPPRVSIRRWRTTSRRSWRSCSASAPSSVRSSPRRPGVCSAASPSSSTG